MTYCQECYLGRTKKIRAPYSGKIGDRSYVVPNVPASICDVCGELTYDKEFVYYLHLLIGPDSAIGKQSPFTFKRPRPSQDPDWRSK